MERKKSFSIEINKNSRFIILTVLIALLATIFAESIYRGGFIKFLIWSKSNQIEILFDYLLVFAFINMLVLFFQGRLYIIITGLITYLLSSLAYISYMKVDLRGEPLTVADFKLYREAVNIVRNFDSSIYSPLVYLVFLVTGIILLAVVFIRLDINKQIRVRVGITSIVLLLILDFLNPYLLGVTTNINDSYHKNGFIESMFVARKALKIEEPENYNQQNMEGIYQRMTDCLEENKVNKDSQNQKPNVIFILGESFWDIDKISSLKLDKEPIPNFKKIAQEGINGTIRVPGIGGGTANTEYEIITGLSKKFVQDNIGAYDAYNNYIDKPIGSLASIFKEKGYAATAIHTNTAWFYNRKDVYRKLGFDKFVSIETLPNKPQYNVQYADDSEVNKLIIDQLQQSAEKDFILAITMQGHGPYDNIAVKNKEIQVKNNLDPQMKNTLENYIYLLNQTDKNLNNLINSLRTYDEPTVVVFFGDHLPPLGNEIYEELGFDIFTEEGRTTPFIIWSNYQNSKKENLDMDAHFLGAYVMNMIGQDDLYMNYLYKLYKTWPLINKENQIEYQERCKDFILLQYDIMHGKQFLYQMSNFPSVNENYSLGEPLTITEVQLAEKGDYYFIHLIGEGFSWMTDFYLNHQDISGMVLDRKHALAIVNKKEIDTAEKLEFRAELLELYRGNVMSSAELCLTKDDALISTGGAVDSLSWKAVPLDGSYDWEFFSLNKGFKMVRVDLGMEQIPYYIAKDKVILKDCNADKMKEGNLSDIYSNGYLYISIPNDDTDAKIYMTKEEIKNYFYTNEHTLYTLE